VKYTARIATVEDAPGVTALLEASYPVLFAADYEHDMLAPALPRLTKANPRLLASGNFFVAESVNGAIVGCGGWSKERPGTNEIRDGEGHVRHFATHPDWLRCGIGRTIIDHCFEQARAAGLRRLECYSSRVAVQFYQAVGFSVVKPMTIELGPDVTLPGLLMQSRIA